MQIIIILFSLFLSVACCSLIQARETRGFQDKKGRKLTGEIIHIADDLVIIKTEKNKEISILFKTLVDADVTYLKQLGIKMQKKTNLNFSKPVVGKLPVNLLGTQVVLGNNLPTLMEGPGKGFHAYYDGEKYIAKVDSKGKLLIFFKDENDKIEDRWTLISVLKNFRIVGEKLKRNVSPKLIKIAKCSEAAMNPAEVKYTFLFEGSLTCEVIFEFNAKGFTTWRRSEYGEDEPENIKHTLTHRFSELKTVIKDNELLEKMEFKYWPIKSKKGKVNFIEDSIPKVGDAKKYEITGPLLGKTKLIINRPKNGVKLILYRYPGLPLYSGFNIYSQKDDYASNAHKKEKTIFTFK